MLETIQPVFMSIVCLTTKALAVQTVQAEFRRQLACVLIFLAGDASLQLWIAHSVVSRAVLIHKIEVAIF